MGIKYEIAYSYFDNPVKGKKKTPRKISKIEQYKRDKFKSIRGDKS